MEREFIWQSKYFCSDRHNCSDLKEEIIRCRDCKQYKEGNHPSVTGKFCHWFSEFEQHGYEEVLVSPYFSNPNDFCSWAERVD